MSDELPERIWLLNHVVKSLGVEDFIVPKSLRHLAAEYVRADLATPAPQWQPIESAPKDGTTIIAVGRIHLDAAGRLSKRVYACATAYHARDESPVYAIGWEFVAPGYCTLMEPAHWMPLPTPSELTEPGAAEQNC